MFMTMDLLPTIDWDNRGHVVNLTTGHDLESFLWVLLYAILKDAIDECGNDMPMGCDHTTPTDTLQVHFDTLFTVGPKTRHELFDHRYLWLGIRRKTALLSHARNNSEPGHRLDLFVCAVIQALDEAVR